MQLDEVVKQVKDSLAVLVGEQFEVESESGERHSGTMSTWFDGRQVYVSVVSHPVFGPVVVGHYLVAGEIVDQQEAKDQVDDWNAVSLFGKYQLNDDMLVFQTHINPPVTPDVLRGMLRLLAAQHVLCEVLAGFGVIAVPGEVLTLIGD